VATYFLLAATFYIDEADVTWRHALAVGVSSCKPRPAFETPWRRVRDAPWCLAVGAGGVLLLCADIAWRQRLCCVEGVSAGTFCQHGRGVFAPALATSVLRFSLWRQKHSLSYRSNVFGLPSTTAYLRGVRAMPRHAAAAWRAVTDAGLARAGGNVPSGWRATVRWAVWRQAGMVRMYSGWDAGLLPRSS